MRIVFVTTASSEGAGGDGRVARELSEALSQEHDVLLVLSGERTSKIKLTPSLSHFEISGKRRGDIYVPFMTPPKITKLAKNLREFSPDIVHLHDQGPIPFVALLWALKNNVPVVFTSHTIPSEIISFGLSEAFYKAKKILDSRFLESYFDLFLKKSSAIVAINDAVLKDLRSLGVKSPMYNIPNGRHLHFYDNLDFADIKEVPKRLLFVGYITERKNQEYLIEVMRYLPREDFVLDLVGVPLNDDYGAFIKDKAFSSDVAVNFLGKVSHSEVLKHLEKAHFFISASLKEVQSLAIIEALASGTPVVSLNNETTEELVDLEVGFNFDQSASPMDFANKITELSRLSSQSYRSICSACKDRVSNMDWSFVVKETLLMYEDVLAGFDGESRLRNLSSRLMGIPEDLLKIISMEER